MKAVNKMYSNNGCLFLMHISVLVSAVETTSDGGGGGAEEMVHGVIFVQPFLLLLRPLPSGRCCNSYLLPRAEILIHFFPSHYFSHLFILDLFLLSVFLYISFTFFFFFCLYFHFPFTHYYSSLFLLILYFLLHSASPTSFTFLFLSLIAHFLLISLHIFYFFSSQSAVFSTSIFLLFLAYVRSPFLLFHLVIFLFSFSSPYCH